MKSLNQNHTHRHDNPDNQPIGWIVFVGGIVGAIVPHARGEEVIDVLTTSGEEGGTIFESEEAAVSAVGRTVLLCERRESYVVFPLYSPYADADVLGAA